MLGLRAWGLDPPCFLFFWQGGLSGPPCALGAMCKYDAVHGITFQLNAVYRRITVLRPPLSFLPGAGGGGMAELVPRQQGYRHPSRRHAGGRVHPPRGDRSPLTHHTQPYGLYFVTQLQLSPMPIAPLLSSSGNAHGKRARRWGRGGGLVFCVSVRSNLLASTQNH